MDDLDRPDLGLHVFEQIEVEMHDQDTRYWRELRKLQMSVLIPRGESYDFLREVPPPPQRPVQLSAILHSYAQALFYVEASKYPPLDQRFRYWLTKLAERIETRVMKNIKGVEASGHLYSLAYHGLTEPKMRQVIGESLQKMIIKFSRDQQPQEAIHPGQMTSLEQDDRPSAPKNRRLSPMVTSPKAARKLEEYLATEGIGLTEFAIRAQTTDRTLRSFRKTGKVRRDIFEDIARAMGTTKDDLLKG
ncbi:MAG: hypothetical protein ACHP8B_05960 [Terriglobales bacterium]